MKELQLNSQWAFASILEILGYIVKGEEKKVPLSQWLGTVGTLPRRFDVECFCQPWGRWEQITQLALL